jgi:hypothetical protein
MSVFPDAMLVRAVTDEKHRFQELGIVDLSAALPESYNFYLLIGAQSIDDYIECPHNYLRPKSGQTLLTFHQMLWWKPRPRYKNPMIERASQATNRPLFAPQHMASDTKDELGVDILSINTEFPTNDTTILNALTLLDEIYADFLPKAHVEQVNLLTNEVVKKSFSEFDPKLIDWCNKSPDRWIQIDREGQDGPWFGVRPAQG